MTQSKFDTSLQTLNKWVDLLDEGYKYLCEFVLADYRFQEGFGAKSHHHNYPGGLVDHTAEVVNYCGKVAMNNPHLDKNILLTAAVWHDYLKFRDYELGADGKPTYTEHKEKIYHIAGSAMEFYFRARECGLPQPEIDSIVHCILAHHGRPEWGSSITPKTPEALTLHYADCMSAWFEDGSYKEKR